MKLATFFVFASQGIAAENVNLSEYEQRGQTWKKFYESMDPQASGEELKAFWEKHAQMKQQLGTQDSYHKSKQDAKYESSVNEKSADHKSNWAEIGELRDAGKWAEAWSKIKVMPKIVEKIKTDPFMKKYWDLNEAGHYKKAHDLMVTYKIQKYGADVG